MKRSNLAVSLYVALLFASGVAVGVFGQRLYSSNAVSAKTMPRSPEEYRKRYIDEMSERLKLSGDQVAQLQVILDATRAKFRANREKHKPEMRAIYQEQVDKVTAMLSDSQRLEYKKMHEEREKRMREKESREKDKPGC